MANKSLNLENEEIYVGVDVHIKTWYVTVRTQEIELFKGAIEGNWEKLKNILEKYRGKKTIVVYEAGYFGYSLHDSIVRWGGECIVTPPSLIPQESGNRVKTDKKDSRKLAYYLAKGMLKKIYVPTPEERGHRQVTRRRRQLVADRVRVQNRIKAELRFFGIDIGKPSGPWSKTYVGNLKRVNLGNKWAQESYNRLIEEYEFLSSQVDKQTALLKELSQTQLYKERVEILQSIPGIAIIAAMEMLVELQDVSRFRSAEQLAAYVGLTPSQHSSSDKVRMGRITGAGKNNLRAILVESAWVLINKDEVMNKKYQRIKLRSGAKRAIVAIARSLVIRARRILLNQLPYELNRAA